MCASSGSHKISGNYVNENFITSPYPTQMVAAGAVRQPIVSRPHALMPKGVDFRDAESQITSTQTTLLQLLLTKRTTSLLAAGLFRRPA